MKAKRETCGIPTKVFQLFETEAELRSAAIAFYLAEHGNYAGAQSAAAAKNSARRALRNAAIDFAIRSAAVEEEP